MTPWPALLAAALPLSAATYTLYVQEGSPAPDYAAALAEVRRAEPEAEFRVVPLRSRNTTPEQARAAADAIRDGATALPCLVLADDAGAYAALPLGGVNAESLAKANAQAAAEGRATLAANRLFRAECYLLYARLGLQEMTPQNLAECKALCQKLMEQAQQRPAALQELGLRAMYPLLLLEYAQGYAVHHAHTPTTEAKLLEAIAVLEAARDLDPASRWGKAAHAERERLRMARRQARQAE